MAEEGMFSYIDAAIEQLNGVKGALDSYFIQLNGKTQEYVDDVIVNEINPTINCMLAKIRQAIIDSGQAMYSQYEELTTLITPISSAEPTNLTKVIDFCLAVKDFLVKAYSTFATFITQLTLKLIELNEAIVSLISYTPPVSINFDKLDIQMKQITLSDITGES